MFNEHRRFAKRDVANQCFRYRQLSDMRPNPCLANWFNNAEKQYLNARIQPRATLAEHLQEFDELWTWTIRRWREDLSSEQLAVHDSLASETECHLFRILRNFARFALEQGSSDFPFPLQHVASRLGVSFQHISKQRQKFIRLGLIMETQPARINSKAARFSWYIAGPGA